MKKQLIGLFLIAMSFFWLGWNFIPAPRIIGQIGKEPSLDLNGRVSAKVATLNQVLKDQADNDPRVDKELSHLNQKERLDFRAKYRSLKPEALKDRGLIVYLLGRNIVTQGDLDFMAEVLNERSCLSLENCERTDQKTLSERGLATQLNFPKLVAITALKAKLRSHPSPKMRAAIEEVLQGARSSMNSLIVKAAS
jgi:hypothetical protein